MLSEVTFELKTNILICRKQSFPKYHMFRSFFKIVRISTLIFRDMNKGKRNLRLPKVRQASFISSAGALCLRMKFSKLRR